MIASEFDVIAPEAGKFQTKFDVIAPEARKFQTKFDVIVGEARKYSLNARKFPAKAG